MLVSTSIPNLLSGVSQQPASMRFPSQAERQVNAYPSVIDGLIKRPPTEHVTKMLTGQVGPCHCHLINRDTTERYAVVFRNNLAPLVYDLVSNTVETVSTPDGVTYLSTPAPNDDLRVVTVADFTFVTNRNVVPQMLPSKTPNRGKECLITVVSGQYGCDYKVSFPNGGANREYVVSTKDGANPSDSTDIKTDFIAQRLADQMSGPTGLNSGGSLSFTAPFSVFSNRVFALNGTVYVATSAGLYVSTNSGGSYTTRTTANGLGSNSVRSVFAVGSKVYAGTTGGLSVSLDGGTSFSLVGSASRSVSCVYADGNLACAGTVSLAGNAAVGLLLSSDGGLTFSVRNQSNGLPSLQVNGVWIEGNTIYAATDNGLAVSTNSGESFTTRSFSGTNRVTDVYVDKTTGKVYVTTNSTTSSLGSVWVSVNGGASFDNMFGTQFGSQLNPANAVYASGNSIYIASEGAGLRVSNDGGTTFTTATGPINSTVNGVWRDGPRIYAAHQTGFAQSLLNGTQGYTDWVVTRQGSTIWIHRGAAQPYGDFTFPELTDSRNNSMTSFAGSDVQNLVDLPVTAPHGYVAKVVGDPDAVEDEYWVRFASNTGNGFGTGLWEETVAPDIKFQINPALMPHVLVRKADGTFEFKQAQWEQRTVGNDESSPEPSFIGRPVKDIFFFKNRLGFLADDKIILSEAGQYFNFWRTSVLQVLDGDPVDLGVAHTKVALLNAAVPYSDSLILFSDQTQFILGSGGELLTPKTASITQTTEFRSSATARPVTNGKSIFFAESRGDFSGLREYVQIASDSRLFDAENLTQQVSAYIRGEIREIEPSTHDNIVFVRAAADDTLYGYKYLMNGPNRIQSAWFEFTFAGAIIKGIGWVESVLYLFVQRPDGLYLERMVVEPGRRDPNLNLVVHLDRRMPVKVEGSTAPSIPLDGVAYNPLTGTTAITLPYEIRSLDSVQVVSVDFRKDDSPPLHPIGKLASCLSLSQNKTTLTVDGDWSTTPFYIGDKYEMVYQTSTPYIRQSESNVIVPQGRFQLTYGEIVYTNSSFFVVEITPKYRDTFYYPFTGNTVGATAQVNVAPVVSGSFRFPVFAKNDEVTITIRNDSPLPCGLTSIDYEATYNTRSRRI